MNKEQIVYKKLSELHLNDRNPRINDNAVDVVAKSIEKYGFKNPLIVDSKGKIWCGNTRFKASKKAVNIGVCSALLFILIMQLDLLFIPSESGEFIHTSMNNIFGIDSLFIWVTISSVLMFYLSNLADVWLFDKLRKKTKGRHLWFANNIATITCNCLENFVFVILGYYVLQLIFIGKTIYTISQCLAIAGTTCMFEIIISLLDTPFLYLAKHKFKKNKDASEKGE